jgi:hypothetical protein
VKSAGIVRRQVLAALRARIALISIASNSPATMDIGMNLIKESAKCASIF